LSSIICSSGVRITGGLLHELCWDTERTEANFSD